MALMTFKPTSPGRRAMVRVSTPACTRARRTRRWSKRKQDRRPQPPRPHHHPPHRRWPQAALPHHRLQARQGRHPGARRAGRVRPEPHRAHRAAVLRRRRAPLHHRAQGHDAGRPADGGPRCADQGRQHAAAAQHADRLDRALHRDEARQGRADRARRRRRRAADRPRAGLRHAAPALRRDAQGAGRLPRDDRRSRQRRAQPREARQGRRQALARHPPDRPRRGDEPGRPSARRWRRPSAGQGNPHPVSPWGLPTKGYKTRKNKRTQKFIVRDRTE